MARGTANCHCRTCGKDFIKYGYDKRNRREADAWEAWAEANIDKCDDCWKAERAAERAAFVEEANKQLPAFTAGSEKQIAWAEKIRANATKGLYALADKTDTDMQPVFTAFVAWLFSDHTGARWWIDHRDDLNKIDVLSFQRGRFLGELLVNYAVEIYETEE